MKTLFLATSNILVALAYLVYIHGIVRGTVRPHRTTRLVIFTIVLVAFLSLIAQGSTVTVWLMGISLCGSGAILLLSIKRGMGGWAKIDIASLVIAGLGIVLWRATDNPSLALYSSILADFSGVVPTLIKAYRSPRTESALFFLMGSFSAALNLAAQSTWKFSEIAYPLYLVGMNLCLAALIVRPGKLWKKMSEPQH